MRSTLHSLCLRGLICLIAPIYSALQAYSQVQEKKPYQSEVITLKLSNTTISNILWELEKTARIKIKMDGITLSGMSDKTTVNYDRKTIAYIINDLFKGEDLKIVFEPQRTVRLIPKALSTPNGNTLKVIGKVVDKTDGQPLPGATILVTDGTKGTGKGCITDTSGQFMIDVPLKYSISTSYIGYKKQSMQVSRGYQNLVIELVPDDLIKGEVVVTGLSKRSKESFTGNYVVIKGDELRKLSPNNMLKGLEIFDPSFRIVVDNLNGSDPNAIQDFRIRGDQNIGTSGELGATSMEVMLDNVSSRPNTPLFVLDGFIVPLSRILELDPERIGEITILKDAAATAIYGSRASNGVIVVETKIAPDGALSLSYSGTMTLQIPDLSDYNLMNAAEKLKFEEAAGLFPSNNIDRLNKFNEYRRNVLAGVNTYWLSQPLRTAVIQRHSASVGGGTNLFRYSLGLSGASTPGVMKGSSSANKSISLNMSYRLKKWSLGASVNLSNMRRDISPYGSFASYSQANPYYPIRDPKTGEITKYLEANKWDSHATRQVLNPLWASQFKSLNFSESMNIFTGLNIEYSVLKNLRLSATMSYTRGIARSENFKSKTLDVTQNDPLLKGSYAKSVGESRSWSTNLGINYNILFNKHLISTFGNITMNSDTNNSISMSAQGYPDDNMDDFIFGFKINNTPSGMEQTSRSMGFTGQFSYSYDNRYSIDANIRGDISSRFADQSIQPFWSVGARWNADKERWLQGRIPYLTFRLSYGVTGSQSFDPYQAIEFYTFSEKTRKPYIASNTLGAVLMGLPNPSLSWAKTHNYSLSSDLGLLKNRLNFSLNIYNNITQNLLVPFDLIPSTGFSQQTVNAGQLQNRGADLSVSGIVIQDRKHEINWTISANANHNKNTILKLSNAIKTANDEALKRSDGVNTTPAPYTIYQEGNSTSTLYTVRSLGIDPTTGQEVYLKRNGKKTFVWDALDKVPVGDSNPTISGSISTAFSWKGFNCSIATIYKWGGVRYNNTLVDKLENRNVAYNSDRRAMDVRWKRPGDVTRYKKLEATGSSTPESTRFIIKDNEIYFASINFGYRFRDIQYQWLRKASISALSLNFTTNDLLRLSTVRTERGLNYPFARSYTMSMSIVFK